MRSDISIGIFLAFGLSPCLAGASNILLEYEKVRTMSAEQCAEAVRSLPDLMARGKYGGTALHVVGEVGPPGCVAALVAAGAEIEARDINGYTPLHSVVLFGTAKHIPALVKAGANVDALTSDGEPALLLATHGEPSASVEKIRALVEAGADPDLPNRRWQTALHRTLQRGLLEGAIVLLEAGADVLIRDKAGQSAVHFFAEFSWQQDRADSAVMALINAGADVNGRDFNGNTPLHVAALVATDDVVIALVRAGADVNAGDNDGRTPLHKAAGSGGRNLAVLLSMGADVNAPDRIGQTPLHEAAAVGWPGTVTQLLQAGASGSITDASGRTPYDFAKNNKFVKDTRVLGVLNAARNK